MNIVKKTYLNGSSGYWWLRSTKTQWSTFYRVDLSGTLSGANYVYSSNSIGVVFAFCI